MPLTTEQIEANNDIPTSTIFQDIADTQKEIADFQDEKDVLMRNPQQNRLKIYTLEGRISQRVDFINNLQQIIAYRKGKEKQS